MVILDENGCSQSVESYEYTVYNSQKIYYDQNNYFRYVNNQKQIITKNSSSNNEEWNFLKKWTYEGHLHCNSAIEYYIKAKEFSEWVNSSLSGISQANAVDVEGNPITDFAINTGTAKIFNLNSEDPMLDSSTFNQNRISVIRRTIQSTLNSAIANYSSNANYEFAMPIFTEEDWDKLVNNISVASFMQGIPIGAKYYNNYCIITNNKNKEVVTKDSIYIITNDDSSNQSVMNTSNQAHRPSSKDVINNKKTVIGAYRNVDFEPQTVVGTYDTYTYYPHANERCYECLVSVAETYSIDDIISGTIYSYDKSTDTYTKDTNAINNLNTIGLRKIYLTALARERQNLYKTNGYFGT